MKILQRILLLLTLALLGVTYYLNLMLSYIDWPFIYAAGLCLIIIVGLQLIKKP